VDGDQRSPSSVLQTQICLLANLPNTPTGCLGAVHTHNQLADVGCVVLVMSLLMVIEAHHQEG